MRHWLIEKRRFREMTQIIIAKRIGISRSYYTQLELDQRSPSIRVAKLLAELLEFDWTFFFDDRTYRDYPPGQTNSAP